MNCLLFESDYTLSELDKDDYSKINPSLPSSSITIMSENDSGDSRKLYNALCFGIGSDAMFPLSCARAHKKTWSAHKFSFKNVFAHISYMLFYI